MFRLPAPPFRAALPRAGTIGLALTLSASVLAVPARAADAPLDRKAVEAIVRDYILTHPEIIVEAINELQRREQASAEDAASAAIRAHRDELFESKGSPVIGNPKGDITLVEFFDYQCGYCKASKPEMDAAAKADGKVRLVMKEFPILGPDSVMAAKAALAAHAQKKYAKLHDALMAHKGPLDEDTIMTIAKSAGLDTKRLRQDMESEAVQKEIDANLALARTLGIRGTPAFIIGDRLVPGAIDEDAFRKLFAEARAAEKEG